MERRYPLHKTRKIELIDPGRLALGQRIAEGGASDIFTGIYEDREVIVKLAKTFQVNDSTRSEPQICIRKKHAPSSIRSARKTQSILRII